MILKSNFFYSLPVVFILLCCNFSEAGILLSEPIKDNLNPVLVLRGGDIFENKTCNILEDCASVNNSICSYSDHLCTCPEDKPIFVNVTTEVTEGGCLEGTNHTQGNCSYTQQCTFENSICSNKVCACEESFIDNGEGVCAKSEKSAIIPIVVGSVIGVACLGTLLAYWWMSRKSQKNN